MSWMKSRGAQMRCWDLAGSVLVFACFACSFRLVQSLSPSVCDLLLLLFRYLHIYFPCYFERHTMFGSFAFLP